MSASSNYVIRPVADPRIIENVYSNDQYDRLTKLIREQGPWKMILALHFKSPEEVVATTSGAVPEGAQLTWDMFLSPNFRGYLGKAGVSLYEEIDDLFYNPHHLAQIRSYWNAKYAVPDNMNFVVQGPSRCSDPGHLDATEFRGVTQANTPIWLLNTMAKSGLFQNWLLKKGQVIGWFYRGQVGGGFTYWPDGIEAEPKRLPQPMWNKGIVSQNEMMFHRGEANGPVAQRTPEGLTIDSLLYPDPADPGAYLVKTGDRTIQHVPASEARLMVHWGGSVYRDMDEMKMVLEHRDDLTHTQVFDMFIKDLRARGLQFAAPSEPLLDRDFIRLLTQTYDLGRPRIYPQEAPGPHQEQIAA
jgi:hypothetical protein